MSKTKTVKLFMLYYWVLDSSAFLVDFFTSDSIGKVTSKMLPDFLCRRSGENEVDVNSLLKLL